MLNMLCSRLMSGASYFCEASAYIWTGGSNTSPYDTWAKAANSTTTGLADAITGNAAGTDYYMDEAMNISNASAQTVTFKGTNAAPDRFFSCHTITNQPPVEADISTTPQAQFTTTGSSAITVRGVVYCRAIKWNVGNGAGTANLNLANVTGNSIEFDNCLISMLATGASAGIGIGSNAWAGNVKFKNTPVLVNGTSVFTITVNNIDFYWSDTPSAVQGSSSAIANLISPASSSDCLIMLDSVDFAGTTGIASGKNIIAAAQTNHHVQMTDCKILSGANFCATPTGPGFSCDVIYTDSGATNWKGQRKLYSGTLDVDNTVYNNATDGTNHYSWKIATSANAKSMLPFETMVFSRWVAAGTYAASKVFITSTDAALKTDDVWVEGQYLGANYALGSRFSTYGAGNGNGTVPLLPGPGSSGSSLAASSPGWGTPPASNHDYQLAIPSFTTSADGYIFFTVKVGKLSTTVYIDPKVLIA